MAKRGGVWSFVVEKIHPKVLSALGERSSVRMASRRGWLCQGWSLPEIQGSLVGWRFGSSYLAAGLGFRVAFPRDIGARSPKATVRVRCQ